MSKIGITIIFLCCILSTIVSAGDSYLCVADMATGFKYNKPLDKWEIVKFNVDDSKYVVIRSNDKDNAWIVKIMGESSEYAFCRDDFRVDGYLFCEQLSNDFRMNKFNLRFINIHSVGYYNSISKNNKNPKFSFANEEDFTPFMEIGKCSPLP